MHFRFVCLLLAAVVLSGTGVFSQAPKDTPKDPPAKGQLPAYWKQLGLSKDQTQEVYTIQAKYRADIDKLAEQIKELREKERKELDKILTDAQKARLREIVATKAGVGEEKKDKDKSDSKDKDKADKAEKTDAKTKG
jgi:hypothetical protein